MKKPEIIELQDDNSAERQNQLIIDTLPSLEAVLVIGRRAPDHPDKANFLACRMKPHELVNSLINAMLANETVAVSMIGKATCD